MMLATTIRFPVALSIVSLALSLSVGLVQANTLLNIGGMGEPLFCYEARALGMGGACIALYDGANTSLLNPSSSTQLSTTLLTVTYLRYQTKYSLQGADSVVVEHNMPNLSFTALVPKVKIPITISYRSNYDWGFKVTQPLIANGVEIGKETGIGKGSVNSFSVGVARPLWSWFSLGLQLDYYFGDPKEAWVKDFSDDNYTDMRDVLDHSMRGPSFTVGAVSHWNMGLDIGWFYHYKAKLSTQDTVTCNGEEISTKEYSITYPSKLGFGLAYHPYRWITTSLDAIYTKWSDFQKNGLGADFRNTTEFHFGVELIPSSNPKAFKLFRLPYRLGLYYIPWYASDPQGGRYNELGATFGLGYLFGANENSRVDVGVQFGRRGGGALALHEQIFRLYFSLSAQEKWLGKFTED
jgi:hypothetical protein